MTDKTEHTADVIQIGFRIEKRKENLSERNKTFETKIIFFFCFIFFVE